MNKQIEELTETLCEIECKGMKCDTCDRYGCEYRMLAEALYEAGYRRQYEVATEIISDIEQAIFAHGTKYALKRLAELKKK